MLCLEGLREGLGPGQAPRYLKTTCLPGGGENQEGHLGGLRVPPLVSLLCSFAYHQGGNWLTVQGLPRSQAAVRD